MKSPRNSNSSNNYRSPKPETYSHRILATSPTRRDNTMIVGDSLINNLQIDGLDASNQMFSNRFKDSKLSVNETEHSEIYNTLAT